MNFQSPAKWASGLGFGLTLVLTLNSLMLYQCLRTTRAVLRNLQNNVIEEQVFSDLKDAECGQRGFLYTDGDDQYLPQYYVGVEDTKADMVILEQYLSEDPGSRAIVKQLRKEVDIKLNELDSTVGAFRGGDPKKAKAIVLSGLGMRQMERIRLLVGLLRAKERDAVRRSWFMW